MKEDQTKHQSINHPISSYRFARFLCFKHIMGLSYTSQKHLYRPMFSIAVLGKWLPKNQNYQTRKGSTLR